jgi:hypothetical protein
MKSYQLVLRSAEIPNYDTGVLVPYYDPSTNYPSGRVESYDDNYYTINANQTQMTFKQVYLNLRSILGTTHTYFKLKVNSITFGMSADGLPFSNDERDRCFNIELSGLQFLGSQQNSNSYTEKIILASVRVPAGSTMSTFSYVNREVSFLIPESEYNFRPNLTITYRDLESNQILPNGALVSSYPNIQLNLSFY